jgi:hypothetical protein
MSAGSCCCCSILKGPLGGYKPGWELTACLQIATVSSHHCILYTFCFRYCCSILKGPLGGNKPGWELTASRTAPLPYSVTDSRVHFGDLIGSGAFGLVYK